MKNHQNCLSTIQKRKKNASVELRPFHQIQISDPFENSVGYKDES